MAKHIIFIIIILCTCFNCNETAQKNEPVPKADKKIYISKKENDKTAAELYKESLSTLDSIVKYSKSNDDFAGIEAIKTLSEISGYEGSGDQNYFGTFGFKDEDLAYWKKWFEENKDSLGYLFHIQSPLEYALNIDKYYILKIDSLQNFYLIYLKKGSNHYKVVSEKIEKRDKCRKIKRGDYLSLKLKSIIPDTSRISYKVEGVLYKGTEFDFERPSYIGIYEADKLTGLCYVEK